jgi:hypothetical protein
MVGPQMNAMNADCFQYVSGQQPTVKLPNPFAFSTFICGFFAEPYGCARRSSKADPSYGRMF